MFHPDRKESRFRCIVGLLALFFALSFAPSLSAEPIEQAFRRRMEAVEDQMDTIVRAADASAQRLLDNPDALLNVPWRIQRTFCEEKLNRAGGLAHAFPTEVRWRRQRQTPDDVVLLSVRSWEESGEEVVAEIVRSREQGWLVTLIASSADKPDDVAPDFFIDNGAMDGGAEHGGLNAIVNSMLGWMWVGEYAAAMTRRGRVPAILRSVAYDDARASNRLVQTHEGRHTTFPVSESVESGLLARKYLERVIAMIDDVESGERRRQIMDAARLIRQRMDNGNTVWLSGVGHMIEHEMYLNMFSDWQPLRSRGGLERNLSQTNPGDLVVWIGYIGMNSRYRDYEAELQGHGLDFITCYKPTPADWSEYTDDPNVMRDSDNTLAQIDQVWTMGDAEVPVPGPAERMGPISGLNAMLLCRMLDAAVAGLLPAEAEAAEPVLEMIEDAAD